MKVLWVNNESSEHPWIYYQFIVSHAHSHQNPFPNSPLPSSFLVVLTHGWASLVAQTVKNLPVMRETWVQSWAGKIPWRREWLTTPVFWPGEFCGQRRLAGYSPWGHKDRGTTE